MAYEQGAQIFSSVKAPPLQRVADNVMMNVEPSPVVLFTVMCPPWPLDYLLADGKAHAGGQNRFVLPCISRRSVFDQSSRKNAKPWRSWPVIPLFFRGVSLLISALPMLLKTRKVARLEKISLTSINSAQQPMSRRPARRSWMRFARW
jgi:hypothetical protein